MPTFFDESPELGARLHAALAMLVEAHALAADAHADGWEFAVEVADLQAIGLSKNAIRWLVHKGYARHAVETTQPIGQARRQFCSSTIWCFHRARALVLTEAGARFARGRLRVGATGLAETTTPDPGATTLPPLAEPHWDARARVLSYAGKVVKHFRVPAGNQELVLSAFQEEGWPQAIDDPLPPAAGIDAKRRLHDTINRLNRNQRQQLLHFWGNGSGKAVCWSPAASGTK
jgi:hypothetical protein